ncbi:MAG: hypothetical protein IJP65_01370 [Bacteroidales bacterium]|nr:hypothetical protein [Bacteroidales bacterium]
MPHHLSTFSSQFSLSPAARHYHPTLSIWLSVDPMADKYPGVSPYTYCGNNPVRLVDKDGREVEYASFWDRIIVGFERIFNSYFRKTFRELKESSETYVFRKHSYNELSHFSCEGTPNNAKLYINYGMGDAQKKARETIFSQLCHESEHARQFEHGELGFSHRTKNILIAHPNEAQIISVSIDIWDPIAYDLNDEIKAHDASIMGFRWKISEYGARDSSEERKKYLKGASAYNGLQEFSINIPFKEKRKDSHAYYLPFKE